MSELRQRKLQAIYAALESHNLKQVIKLCEKKDVEKWPVAKALKACALVQQGRQDAAMDLCREAQAVSPMDESTLEALIHAYHMMGCHLEMTALVDSACKATPNNLHLLNQLFLCHVRSRDFAKAQQTATRLYKLDQGSGRYILWAATTMLLQQRRGTAPPTALVLAERMVKKALDARSEGGDGDPTGEELSLYVTLLSEQGKHEDALAAAVSLGGSTDDEAAASGSATARVKGGVARESEIASESDSATEESYASNGKGGETGSAADGNGQASAIISAGDDAPWDRSKALAKGEGSVVRLRRSERRQMEADLLVKLGRKGDSLAIMEELLQGNPDEWSYYTTVFDLKLGQHGDEGRSERAVDSFSVLQAKVREYQATHPKFRGPLLAELELLKRFMEASGADATLPDAWLPSAGSEASESAAANGALSEASAAMEGLPHQNAAAELGRLIVAYYGIFGSKLCCYYDLAPYVAVFVRSTRLAVPEPNGAVESDSNHANGSGSGEEVTPAVAAAAADALRAFLSSVVAATSFVGTGAAQADSGDAGSREDGVKRLHRHISALQLLQLLCGPEGMSLAATAAANGGASGPNGSADGAGAGMHLLLAGASALVSEYRATLHLNDGAEGGQREVQHGDELVLLAAHALRSVYRRKNGCNCAGGTLGKASDDDRGYLLRLEAAALLEYAMERSPHNHQFKILAMEVYRELGAFERGILLDNALDIKQIQLDSLSWLVLPGCVRCGFFVEAHSRCRGILALHRASSKDTAEFIGRAFKHGNYSKAVEMATFQERRMDSSLQLALAKLEVSALELAQAMHNAGVATAYLKECAMGVLPEAFAAPPGGLAALSDNLDREVAVAWDVPVGSAGAAERIAAGAVGPPPRAKLEAHVSRRMTVQSLLLSAMAPGAGAGSSGEGARNVMVARLEDGLDAAGCGKSVALAALASDRAETDGNASDGQQAKPASDAGSAGGVETCVGCAGHPCKPVGEREVQALGWRVLLELVAALAQVRLGVSQLGDVTDAAALRGASAHLQAATEAAAALQRRFEGLGLGVHACDTVWGALGAKRVSLEHLPLSPAWLAAGCKWLVDAGTGASLLLQTLWQALPPPRRKAKGKAKGKKASSAAGGGAGSLAGTAPASSPELAATQEALVVLGTAVVGIFAALSAVASTCHKSDASRRAAALCALLRGAGNSSSSSSDKEFTSAALAKLWAEDGEGGGAAALQRTADLVAQGQQTSSKRLHEVLREKLVVLQALPGLK